VDVWWIVGVRWVSDTLVEIKTPTAIPCIRRRQPMTDDLERHVHERFIRSSGPGGQNVNKVATAVELRFDVRASGLPDAVKDRLIALAAKRITADGQLLIDSRAFRTQARNREAARERLVALIDLARREPKKRRPTRPKTGAKEQRLQSKKRRSAVKALRSSRDED
jgi:ribosome-associated protein